MLVLEWGSTPDDMCEHIKGFCFTDRNSIDEVSGVRVSNMSSNKSYNVDYGVNNNAGKLWFFTYPHEAHAVADTFVGKDLYFRFTFADEQYTCFGRFSLTKTRDRSEYVLAVSIKDGSNELVERQE